MHEELDGELCSCEGLLGLQREPRLVRGLLVESQLLISCVDYQLWMRPVSCTTNSSLQLAAAAVQGTDVSPAGLM